MKRSLSLIWVLFLLAACVPPGIPLSGGTATTTLPTAQASTPSSPTVIPPTETLTPAVTLSPSSTPSPFTPTPVITDTPGGPPMGQCGYQWATQNLPDVTAKLSQAYQAAGLPDIQAHALAYGENCLDAKGNVVSFSAMETDYTLLIPVTSRSDTQEMGDQLAKALPVLDQFPVGQTPGPNPGYVTVQLKDSAGEQYLHFLRTRGEDAIKQGLAGSALYNALLNP